MPNKCTPDIKTLKRLCRLTNRQSFALSRFRATCIFTSATLCDVLNTLGIPAEMLRVEAAYYGPKYGVVLGSDSDGTRRRAAQPGMWHGHVAVVAAERYLLDPTLDQIPRCKPFTSEVNDAWLSGRQPLFWADGVRLDSIVGAMSTTSILRYRAFPGRCGWKSAGDFRVSRRRDLVDSILTSWEG